ncbi:class I SAM-dependent methyltransferase [Leptospira sp. 2 VSF19]|uniref:Class I SAM-dependent methyltransferase n=1 Tax=Leptospira soteropolitanensis TaxID=2950025 RepID=A0AAW5VEU0_9LEPT|nr:class I SAM-dependent methyltransferase [Leptospira soteropolitanensis]MCW7492670.1 class I SAM-dependent methyltransferase [Leptospira soteropolitanensis]MCW7500353.1 class I SAM-dependent methyltransferase [Leptospira soteropolitanensis]MCW7522612.1 class I SAM-dependent methyltransferase [Leptospira soteropolitanensis]MCW7526468.1 class I SAM-dependent methyltransferase [Leptospira soteropolitanensis]MCW7530323.1 class I SAM-dependent methyltransferase [Leptospira soteropolitanensis]
MKGFLNRKNFGLGKNGKKFDGTYWSDIYGNGLDVDGSYNAKQHAEYLKSLFQLMEIPVYRMADFGFGKAILLREMVKTFSPVKVYAVDASKEAYEDLKKKDWVKKSDKFHIYHESLETLKLPKLEKDPVELGICNSVIQYLPDSMIPNVLEKMAKYCNYLYFTVPTNEDYAVMKEEMKFTDPYAFSRSKKKYRKWISRDFEIVGYNLLQSKWLGEKGFKEDFFRI